jgi:hypothetical protein
VFGPLPSGLPAVPGPAEGGLTHTPRGHAWCRAPLGGPGARPDARGRAIRTRGLMQAMLETRRMGGVECRLNALGPRRWRGHACQACRIQGRDAVADGLHATAHPRRHRLRRQPAGTRQHKVGTTPAEGLGGAPIGCSRLACIIGQGSDIEHWFHDPNRPWEVLLHNDSCGNALGSILWAPGQSMWAGSTRQNQSMWAWKGARLRAGRPISTSRNS